MPGLDGASRQHKVEQKDRRSSRQLWARGLGKRAASECQPEDPS